MRTPAHIGALDVPALVAQFFRIEKIAVTIVTAAADAFESGSE